MSNGSIAPRERVNIIYRPANNPNEEKELPLKLFVVGDFTGQPDDRPVESRDAVNIDKDNFDAVLKAQDVKLDIAVKNTTSDDPDAQLGVSLKFESMKDFTPDGIAQQVPDLKKMLELRQALLDLKRPAANVDEFKKTVKRILGGADETTRKALLKELGLSSE